MGGGGRFDICVMTCERTPSYIDRTLASMCLSDREGLLYVSGVNLIVDSANQWYLKDYSVSDFVQTHYLTEAQESAQNALSPRERIYLTLNRALTLPLPTGCVGRILMEDDVLFRSGWVGCLHEALQHISSEAFGLWLYKPTLPYRHDPSTWRSPYHFEPESLLSGLCGVYFSKPALAAIGNRRVPSTTQQADGDLGLHLGALDVVIFALLVDIVQHEGYASSEAGTIWHKGSPTFAFPWEPLSAQEWQQSSTTLYSGATQSRS